MGTGILIIDDKVKVCRSLAQNFEHLGYRTVIATSGKEALAAFSAGSSTSCWARRAASTC